MRYLDAHMAAMCEAMEAACDAHRADFGVAGQSGSGGSLSHKILDAQAARAAAVDAAFGVGGCRGERRLKAAMRVFGRHEAFVSKMTALHMEQTRRYQARGLVLDFAEEEG